MWTPISDTKTVGRHSYAFAAAFTLSINHKRCLKVSKSGFLQTKLNNNNKKNLVDVISISLKEPTVSLSSSVIIIMSLGSRYRFPSGSWWDLSINPVAQVYKALVRSRI